MNSERLFPKLSQYQIDCCIEAGEELRLRDGEVIFREGIGTADFFVVLEGAIKVTRRADGDHETVLVVHQPGEFTGTTDLLTGEVATATGFAVGPTRVARVPAAKFRDLLLVCPEMRAILLPALTERRTTEYAIEVQQQKLAALGKMSAGLAHELNNPASAARSSAQNLQRLLGDVQGLTCELLHCMFSHATGDGAVLEHICELAGGEPRELDPLTRSDLEQELGSWLEKFDLPEPWEAAAAFISVSIGKDDLAPLEALLDQKRLGRLLTWLARDITMRALCRELEQSTSRISELVCAMKSYSYMDRATAKAPTDLRQGIDTTLTIMKHKLKKKDLIVQRNYAELPPVPAYGGELNQVWTNLIHNAIDAAPPGGHISIRTWRESDQAVVEVKDDGPGIPPELRTRIFEPFFTTKPVGQGTGLGLDMTYRIIRNHHGDIRFESRPGDTRFIVTLPLNEQGGSDNGQLQARQPDPARAAAV
ncbi:MAG TPA: ATP-binding protein [Tepidisphaeraceae bacterium]|nr:ATP-binding protein [Tepidisphaeraceae bacterium]